MKARQIAEKMIRDAEAMIKEGQDRLDALDKPELKPWDYGVTDNGGYWIMQNNN